MSAKKTCDTCKKREAAWSCGGCGKRLYCSEICGQKDWKVNGHRDECPPSQRQTVIRRGYYGSDFVIIRTVQLGEFTLRLADITVVHEVQTHNNMALDVFEGLLELYDANAGELLVCMSSKINPDDESAFGTLYGRNTNGSWTNLNSEMVRRGVAWAYPSTTYQSEQQWAQQRRKGLWGLPNPPLPPA